MIRFAGRGGAAAPTDLEGCVDASSVFFPAPGSTPESNNVRSGGDYTAMGIAPCWREVVTAQCQDIVCSSLCRIALIKYYTVSR